MRYEGAGARDARAPPRRALPLAGLEGVIDRAALERMVAGGLAVAETGPAGEETLTLTARGRFLGDAVTAELLV